MNEIKSEYAKALFELALEENNVSGYLDVLLELKSLFLQNSDYLTLLHSPVISVNERLSLIDDAFSKSVSCHILSFMKLLCQNGDMDKIIDCIDEFEALEREVSNTLTVNIRSVIELDDEQKAALVKKLSAKYQKNIDPVYIIDDTLVGAIKAEVNDEVTDGSVSTRIKKLKEVIGK